MNNKYFTVCGAVFIQNKILLVRHTYGNAKNRILLPGGYVSENELPTNAIIREIYEETSVNTSVNSIISIQFKPEQWCVVFLMDYIDGTPKSDGYENSEVLLLTIEEALNHPDLTNMSRAIISAIKDNNHNSLKIGSYIPSSRSLTDFAIFGVK